MKLTKFEWRDSKPLDEEIAEHMACVGDLFQVWMTLDMAYKIPQPGMTEFIFSDGTIYKNSDYHSPMGVTGPEQYKVKQHKAKWAPIRVIDNDIVPVDQMSIPQLVKDNLSKLGVEGWTKAAELLNYRLSTEKDTMTAHYFYARKKGIVVMRYNQWHSYAVPQWNWLYDNVLPICLSNGLNIFDIYSKLVEEKVIVT